jgi:hypothetical protein
VDLVAEESGAEVVDLVAQRDPADRGLGVGRGDGAPVGKRDVLRPLEVDDVVDVRLAVDLRRLDDAVLFERMRRGRRVRGARQDWRAS